VIENNDNTVDVMDAKWKEYSPESEYDDVIKLWRDCSVLELHHGLNIREKSLIYFKTNESVEKEIRLSFLPNFIVKVKYLDVLRAN
jgi:hypothetical protein